MKKIQLSHSACEKYRTCPALYKYHYIDKLRPEKAGSALFLGSAIDDALNYMLLGKKKKLSKEDKEFLEKYESPEDAFLQTFQTFSHNGEEIDIRRSEKAEYFKSDLDTSVLEEDDFEKLREFDPEVEDHLEYIEEIQGFIKEKKKLDKKDQMLYNYICWLSLRKKGLMLIEAYRQDILPEIEECFSIQQRVHLPNEDGHFIIGFIDAVVSFKSMPGVKVVLDNKTSSTKYKDDSVALSPQLATYLEFKELDHGAYGVLGKKLRKREPRTRTQLIIDKVAEETYDETFEMYDEVLEGIKAEKFEKNYDSGCFQWGKPCPYYRYCRSDGKIKDGLVEVKKKKK